MGAWLPRRFKAAMRLRALEVFLSRATEAEDICEVEIDSEDMIDGLEEIVAAADDELGIGLRSLSGEVVPDLDAGNEICAKLGDDEYKETS